LERRETRREALPDVTIPLRSQEEAILVLGPYDRNAKLMRQALDIEISTRNGNLRLSGEGDSVAEAQRRIEHLLGKLRKGRELAPRDVEAILAGTQRPQAAARPLARPEGEPVVGALALAAGRGRARQRSLRELTVRPYDARTENQRRYLEAIKKRTLTFGLGVAGTGKTFLAIASALTALRSGECRRLIMTRPVVEAGEKLGFLPGDVQAKLNPYMRPVYDALFELSEFEDVALLEEAGVIEVAPLAYMRGRTLAGSFVILDEAQNTTQAQMKMFLTRLGEGSRMVVTGDPTQTDLEDERKSGLSDAVRRLRGFEGVGVVEFGTVDICRHPFVESVVRAYEGGRIER
jgi:phosphate starvation-inducible PhoH-like protein